MDCKNALQEAEGDIDKAIEILRLKGQKVAAKRGDRETGAAGNFGVLLSLNCETDFVAKNDEFVGVAQTLLDLALNSSLTSKEALMEQAYPGAGFTVAEKITEQIGKIGEKIDVSAFQTLSGGQVAAYIHPGNRLATLVAFSAAVDAEVGRDIAMQ